jgi:hypothetical protein
MTAEKEPASSHLNSITLPSCPAAVLNAKSLNQTAVVAEVKASSDFSSKIKPFTADTLPNGFSTLVGAFVGAMLTYAVQRRLRRTIEHKEALVAGHKLMFALLQQINTIVLVQRDYIYSELGSLGRFLSIPALPQFDTKKNVLELPELTFLLDNQEGRSILYEFYIAQENYIEALNQLNLRSVLHHEKVQPAMAASTIKNGALVTDEDIKLALGEHLFSSLVNSTDNVIETLRRAFRALIHAKVKARAYLVRRFKTNDFTDFEYPDAYGLTEDISDISRPET